MRLLVVTAAVVLAAPLAGAQQSHPHHATPISPTAQRQIRDVELAAKVLATPDAARAAGFEPTLGWIPMMGTHWVHGPRMLEGRKSNQTAPSQLMFSPVGGKDTLVGVAFAYYAPLTDAVPPVIFDGAPVWHDHPDLSPPGTNMLMLHVWFVASPDGPFAGMNPYLPFWAAGVTPPDVERMHHPDVAVRVRTAALALAEVVNTDGLFPILARRPAVRPVLEEKRAAIRALVPEIESARRAKDQTQWDGLIAKLGEHWTAMRAAYLASALDPNVRARIAKAMDEMIRGSHLQ